MTKITSQIFSAVVIILLSVLLLNPLGLWMPSMMHTVALTLFLVAFAGFVAFVMQERGGDERESEHRMFSGRIAFLSAAAVAVCGIAYQGITGHIDPWLVAALCVMLIAKIGSHLYSARYR